MELEQHELNYIFLFAKIVSGNRNQLVIQKKKEVVGKNTCPTNSNY